MTQASARAPANDDGLLVLFVLGVVVFAAALAYIWWLLGHRIRYYGLVWAYYQSWLYDWLPPVAQLRDDIALGTQRVATMSAGEFLRMLWAASLPWGWMPIGLGVWAWRRGERHPVTRAKRILSMQDLIEVQARNFSAIAPIAQRDGTIDVSPQVRPADRPEEVAHKHGIVKRTGRFDGDQSERKEIIEFDDARARKHLVDQLGLPHERRANWKAHERALFAVFAEAVCEENDGMQSSRRLRDALNYSATNWRVRPDYSLATPLFKKWWERRTSNPILKALFSRHQHIRTLLYALLMETSDMHTLPNGNRGVLPSAEFIWLRFQDRALWYPLNNAGSKVPMIEAAGVFAQYQAEVLAWRHNRRLTGPYVDEAVEAWREYLREAKIIYEGGPYEAR